MTDKTERNYVGDVVLMELPDRASRVEGTLLTGTAYVTGNVLGQITIGAVTAAAKGGGNTGNGAASALSSGGNAQVGVYKAIVEIAGTNAATWNLYDPKGKLVDQKQYSGSGATAVFANDQIHATITDGGTDFVVGDEFDITVAAGSGKYVLADDTAVDGSQNGAAILLFDYDATGGDVTDAVMLARTAIVSDLLLVWKSSVTSSNSKTAIKTNLLAAGFKFVQGV